MGYGSYNSNSRSVRATSMGYYSKSIDDIFEQNKLNRIHESMSPKGVKVRECCDSEAHPNTVPIILTLDVTGSMGRIPHNLVKDGLPTLMSSLTENGVKDASLLFMAVGDHICDRVPLQIGQFESGDEELDLWLTRTYIEGKGGGNGGESYFLSWYFAANHTKIDSFNKRGKKGYLFTIGDEPCHNNLPKNAIKEITGDNEETNIDVNKLLVDAQKMYNVYHLHIMEGSRGVSSLEYWKELLGDNCIVVDDYKTISTVISDIITKQEKTKTHDIFGNTIVGDGNTFINGITPML